jgi:hypothetical protein
LSPWYSQVKVFDPPRAVTAVYSSNFFDNSDISMLTQICEFFTDRVTNCFG